MKTPDRRIDIPKRNNENHKRKISKFVSDLEVSTLLEIVSYKGSPKHKRNPSIFGLEPFNGLRGDATLCDEHAGMQPQDMVRLPRILNRGISARLVGTNIWTVDDTGWIYEARLTNADQSEYHGYPVRPSEAIAEQVFRRFNDWAAEFGNADDKRAAQNCSELYGFKS